MTCTAPVFDLKTKEINQKVAMWQRRFPLTSSILQSLHRRRCNPHTSQESAARIFVHLLLVPNGDGDAVAARQEKIVVRVPLRVDGRLTNVGGEHLSAIHGDLGEWIRKSYKRKPIKLPENFSFPSSISHYKKYSVLVAVIGRPISNSKLTSVIILYNV